jgi:hypothetical protein
VPPRNANLPTKSDLWCELQASRTELKDISERMANIIQENTVALVSLHNLVSTLSKEMAQQSNVTKAMADKVSEAMHTQATGVPLRVFIIVVVVLCVIILALAGVESSVLGPILGGG